MLPEEKLQRSSAMQRSQSQNQKAKRYKQPSDESATIIGYNADIGANVIQLPDGSISYAGSDTNGAIALGDSVPLQRYTHKIDGLPNIKKQPIVAKKSLPKINYPVKVLFSVVDEETGSTDFYIGGDRKVPTKIFNLKTNRNSRSHLSNTGKKLTDWICIITLDSLIAQRDPQDGVYIITPKETWFYSYSTDIVPTFNLDRPSYEYTVWEVFFKGGGYVEIKVRAVTEGIGDHYYIYKDTITHIAYAENDRKGYALPTLPDVPYQSVYVSPLLNEFISTEPSYVKYINGILNKSVINNYDDVPSQGNFYDNSLISGIIYKSAYDYEADGDIGLKNATVGFERYKIKETGEIEKLDNIKVFVFSIKSSNTINEFYGFSYYPPKSTTLTIDPNIDGQPDEIVDPGDGGGGGN